ncbi:VOC family protein [Pantoea vagans]|uniref:VOC family protein n=1 Tax=Pantoea vagans TaxID=470934 RepID=UPI002899E94E|nr:VOC family protein [Pantoea vagans]
MMSDDTGFTHLSLPAGDLDKSVEFYWRDAVMQVIHQREPGIIEAHKVVWLSDLTRLFALVLVQSDNSDDTPLGPFGHIGAAWGSCEEIDEEVAIARREGVLRGDAQQSATLAGYRALFADPDGNKPELSYGQQSGMETITPVSFGLL